MTPDESFLAAIIKEPEDDSLRLIYADWLEEHGEEDRAEFIRVQVAMAAIGRLTPTSLQGSPSASYALQADKEDQRYLVLQKRILELQSPGRRWWSDYGPGDLFTIEWQRGFVDRAICTTETWMKHGPAFVRKQPVRVVVLADKWPDNMLELNKYWRWHEVRVLASGLPVAIWDVYARLYLGASRSDWPHASRDDALDALSQTCLVWAKEQS